MQTNTAVKRPVHYGPRFTPALGRVEVLIGGSSRELQVGEGCEWSKHGHFKILKASEYTGALEHFDLHGRRHYVKLGKGRTLISNGLWELIPREGLSSYQLTRILSTRISEFSLQAQLEIVRSITATVETNFQTEGITLESFQKLTMEGTSIGWCVAHWSKSASGVLIILKSDLLAKDAHVFASQQHPGIYVLYDTAGNPKAAYCNGTRFT